METGLNNVLYVVIMTELAQQQQQQQSLLARHGGIAPMNADSVRAQDHPTTNSVWRMHRSFQQHHHATTAFSMTTNDNQDDVISTAERDVVVENNRRSTEDDAGTDVDRGYAELLTAVPYGPGKRLDTEWNRVAEILDRFFFFIFMMLLLIPTATILGFVRLFKPEL